MAPDSAGESTANFAMPRHTCEEATNSEVYYTAGCRHTSMNIEHRTREAKALPTLRCPVIRVTRQRTVKYIIQLGVATHY